MEDMKSLLIMVLHKIFHDRPKIVEDTYQLIYTYNSGKKEKNKYEKTLRTICDLMNGEVPSEILVYLLTLVDMPLEQGGNFYSIMDKLQKTYPCLTENIRPVMLEFLSAKKQVIDKNNMPEPVQEPAAKDMEQSVNPTAEPVTSEKKGKTKSISEPQNQNKEDEKTFVKPSAKRKRSKRKAGQNTTSLECNKEQNYSAKPLLDITANYVVRNEQRLKHIYKSRLKQAWKMINSNLYSGDKLNKCYNAVKDLNKKTKLLRCIENDNITEDILMEEYENSEVFLREYNVPKYDPFEVSEEFMTMINNFVASCD
nr:unnamed protein product [Callosobruchus chinensis]